ncbi:MAG: glucose-6-phosphate isomerase [Methanotrichaceae archaeon]|nr:glucose-6-phosphate isomerase [Methanotrichaceae archaeon]
MELSFGGRTREPDVRWLYDMREVIYDQEWLAKAENRPLYYMYRDLYLSRADEGRLIERDLRYDITIIPPGMLGVEFVKTAGHYHPPVLGSDITYPEVYEVLEGEAVYLLQKEDQSDVVAIRAKAGDKAAIPPGYGHITINASNKRLKMANYVARSFSSIYEPIRAVGGGAYFLTEDGFVANPRSPAAPLREVPPPGSAALKMLGLSRGREMYPLIREKPEALDWLVHPLENMDLFVGLLG